MERTLLGKAKGKPNCAAVNSLRQVVDRNRIVEANTGLVIFTLNRYFKTLTGADRDDALSAGYLGLLRAAEGWEPSKGKFSTFACRSIIWDVRNQVRKLRNMGFRVYLIRL